MFDELYQEVILEESQSTRWRSSPEQEEAVGVHGSYKAYNPICGDKVQVFSHVKGAGQLLERVRFEGSGCALSQASSSLLLSAMEGKPVEKILVWIPLLLKKIKGEGTWSAQEEALLQTPEWESIWEKMHWFEGVQAFPMRVKCVTLCAHALLESFKESSR